MEGQLWIWQNAAPGLTAVIAIVATFVLGTFGYHNHVTQASRAKRAA